MVRYFINNEDPAGNPAQIQDVTQTPLNLTIFNPPSPVLSVAEDAQGHRGLWWTMSDPSARASAEIDGTKVETRLDQKQVATIEVVADLDEVVLSTRLVFIGHLELANAAFDAFSLFVNGDDLRLHLGDTEVARWNTNFPPIGRAVLHMVLDTNQATAQTQRKLYINGALVPSASNIPSLRGEKINITASTYLSLGARPSGGTSLQGRVYYAAVYAAALSEVDLQNNAALLLLNDDDP